MHFKTILKSLKNKVQVLEEWYLSMLILLKELRKSVAKRPKN